VQHFLNDLSDAITECYISKSGHYYASCRLAGRYGSSDEHYVYSFVKSPIYYSALKF